MKILWTILSTTLLLLYISHVDAQNCGYPCTDQVIIPLPNNPYIYGITRTTTHCEGFPGTCTVPGAPVLYRSPSYDQYNSRFIKLTAITYVMQLFTLPFSENNMHHNGWLYAPGLWHHAVDYFNGGTFSVKAAAPGKVIYVGWDLWSGNTVVISHDDGGDQDRYRTIYMHLRDGAERDCNNAWSQTVPWMTTDTSPDGISRVNNFRNYLTTTNCNSVPGGTPDSRYWGGTSDRIVVTPGDIVTRGQIIANSGSTGPGGCGCTTGATNVNTHLHIFFTHRDKTDNLWYFFDPYGIYGPPACYPTSNDASGAPSFTPCVRYPVAWKDGVPKLP